MNIYIYIYLQQVFYITLSGYQLDFALVLQGTLGTRLCVAEDATRWRRTARQGRCSDQNWK